MFSSLRNLITRAVSNSGNVSPIPAFGGVSSTSGPCVTVDTALRCSTVIACVRFISESIASLPFHLYQRMTGGGKTRAHGHPLYRMLHSEPNPEQTAYEFLELSLAHLNLYGNSYSEIERNGAGRPIALWPLVPGNMTVSRKDGKLRYQYRVGSKVHEFRPTDVLHIKAFGTNGITGLSPISQARESIGLSLATEEFASRFFSNGATLGKILEHPGRLTDEGVARLRESFTALHGGLSNAHRVAILEEGMKLVSTGVPPKDAEFMDLRKWQVGDIARNFRVQPHLIGDLSRATNNNIEVQGQEAVTYTLRPWMVRIEQAVNRALLIEDERPTYFCEFLIDGLLRGDAKTRAEALQIQRQNGIINADEWREIENKNPLPDGKGQVYITPLNMAPAGSQNTEPEQKSLRETRSVESAETRAKSRHKIAQSFIPVLEDAVSRIVRREVHDVQSLVKKHMGQRDAATLTSALEQFYSDHKDFVSKNSRSAITALADAVTTELEEELEVSLRTRPEYLRFIEEFIDGYAGRFTQSSFRQLKALIEESLNNGSDVQEVLQTRLDEWQERRPAKEAKTESTRIGGAVARTLFVLAGATRLVWRNVGKACPICTPLNGKTVGRDQPFASDGDQFGELKVNRKVLHPPLHKGCDCVISRSI